VSKVIASDVRKGNVLQQEDGKLYTVLKAETYRPGKGTPTATIEMRRIADGVKVVETFKTTDQLDLAFVEEMNHNFLYKDGDDYIFMNPASYEQVSVSEAMLGDAAPYLGENMARAAVRGHADKLGLAAGPLSRGDVERLLGAVGPGLGVFVGREKTARILDEARAALGLSGDAR